MIIVYQNVLKHFAHLTIPCQIENYEYIIFVYVLVRDLSLRTQEQTMQKIDLAF